MNSQPAYFKSPQDMPDDLRALCLEFFFMFSRFEYALQENGFLRTTRYQNAEPDWKKFVKEYCSLYVPSAEARNLIENPPECHIVGDDQCQWKKMNFANFGCDLDKIVFILKTIRNNLFHGGKNSHLDWDDPDRNTFLITNAISVLGNLAKLSELEHDYWRNYY